MATRQVFANHKRLTGKIRPAEHASGTFSVVTDFQPDFIQAYFKGLDAAASDSLVWELVATAPGEWTFTVNYTDANAQEIYWIVARLPKTGNLVAWS